jgi:hypothetical protein
MLLILKVSYVQSRLIFITFAGENERVSKERDDAKKELETTLADIGEI